MTTSLDRLRVVARPDPRPVVRAARRRWPRALRFDGPGLALGLLLVCISLTPSLLPRSPAFQGWLTGIVLACGYALGVLLTRTSARISGRRLPGRLRHAGWGLLVVTAPVAVGTLLIAARGWQREAHALVGQDAPGPGSPYVVLGIAAGVFSAAVTVMRLLRRACRLVSRRLSTRLPADVARVLSVLLVGFVALAVMDQVVMRAAVAAVDRAFSATNDGTKPGVRRPVSPLRSGGPGSAVSWGDLGRQGRSFAAGAPATAELTGFARRPAKDPIRVYVGLETAATISARTAAAMAELDRTGAWQRAVLCVVTTTGTGWVDPQAATALEFLHAGDTAIVATQYSYLPSALSFLLDDRRSELAGADLFARVHERWSAMPAADRPELLVFGESLGTNGGQAAFGKADGELFVGPPNSNQLWRRIVDGRDSPSTERLPVSGGGEHVRFADDRDDLQAFDAEWAAPRTLFLQHASDPIVWWSPDLLWHRPDWLAEARGDDVSRSVSWYPVVTFWQVTADLIAANDVPPGSGHRYGDLLGDAWAALAPPPSWTPADADRLRAKVAARR